MSRPTELNVKSISDMMNYVLFELRTGRFIFRSGRHIGRKIAEWTGEMDSTLRTKAQVDRTIKGWPECLYYVYNIVDPGELNAKWLVVIQK